MEYRPFSDFLDTLTPEKMKYLLGDLEHHEVIAMKGASPENIMAYINHAFGASIDQATLTTLRFLEAYHI